jgi:hypothetical protein
LKTIHTVLNEAGELIVEVITQSEASQVTVEGWSDKATVISEPFDETASQKPFIGWVGWSIKITVNDDNNLCPAIRIDGRKIEILSAAKTLRLSFSRGKK